MLGFLDDHIKEGRSSSRVYGLIASLGFWGSITAVTVFTKTLVAPSEWLVVAYLGAIATKAAQRIWGEKDLAVSSEKTTTHTEATVLTPQEQPK